MARKWLACAALLALVPCVSRAQGTHVVVKGDTLWSLYGKLCGDSFGWDTLYQANKSLINDPHWIYPDMKLSVPDCGGKALPQLADRTERDEPKMQLAAEAQSAVAEETSAEAARPPAEEREEAKPAPATSDIEPKGGYKTMESPAEPGISEDMPKDMAWGVPSSSSEVLPTGWKPDGKVRYASVDDKFDDFAASGDLVEVRMNSGDAVKPGDYLKVYRLGVPKRDDKGKIVGHLAQPSALMRVISVDGKKVKASIVRLLNPVENDDPVKKL
ncbi:MAG: LysM peptidoglycan-binding domain-containing protein [Elusimicrobia bacterium]|nr:LysM peptidoglycan-binding domain-containing protein [Elusimicrobiota bacterium]